MARSTQPSATEIVHRACPLCEATCGIAVEVDRAAGRIVTIRGDDQDPFSRGYLCPKAYGLKALQEDPDRLRRPIRRTASGWEEIGWEEALAFAAEGLRRVRDAHGAEALAAYVGNPNAHDLGAALYLPALLRSLGSKRRFSASSVDQLPKMLSCAAVFGGVFTIPIPDLDRTQYLLVLGANPLASNGSLMTAADAPGRLRRIRERGGRIVVVDPRRSETAEIADEHLFIKPGGDAFFLFALVHVLFEEGLVAMGRLEPFVRGTEALRTLAKEFAPEAVASATGIDAGDDAPDRARVRRRRAGGLLRTDRHLHAGVRHARELAGRRGQRADRQPRPRGRRDVPARGGGTRTGSAQAQRRGSRTRAGARPCASLPEFAGELPAAALAEEIDAAGEQRIRALRHGGREPGALDAERRAPLPRARGARLHGEHRHLPQRDHAVRRRDPAPELAARAHELRRVLRAALRAQHQQALAARVRVAGGLARAVVDARRARRQARRRERRRRRRAGALAPAQATVGGAETSCPDVTEQEARAALGPVRGPERILDLMLRAGPWGDRFDEDGDGLSLAALREAEHGIDLGPLEPRLPELLGTASGAIELAPELLVSDVPRLRAALAERRREDGLVLIGRRHLRSNNSWMHNLRPLAKGRDRCTLLVSPSDAARLGLADGGRARVRSRVGELIAPVAVSDEMMPGVVSLPHGFGHDAPGAQLAVAADFAGVNVNLLNDETRLDVLSGNAVLNGTPVEVAPA